MKILYGTTNQGKLQAMKKSVEGMNLEIICLQDLDCELPSIVVFSCDSGLYFDELDDEEQPGVHVRRVNGKELTDEKMTEYYASLAAKHGGRITGRYRNAIYFILDENHHYSGMDMSIATEPFILVTEPHEKRVPGFPLDCLSVDIATGKYYYDLETKDVSTLVDNGVRKFFGDIFG